MLLLHFMPDSEFLKYASLAQLERRDIAGRLKFSYHPNLGMIPSPGYVSAENQHNSYAFRGPEPAPEKGGEFRIACLGGSTTYDEFIDDFTQSYPFQLERLLQEAGYQVCVLNAGCPGYTTSQSLMTYLFRLKNLDVDMIVVNHGVNDWMERLAWPPDAYRVGTFNIWRSSFPTFMTPDLSDHSTFLRMIKVAFLHQAPASSFMGNGQNNPTHWIFYDFFGQLYTDTYPSGDFADHSLAKRMAVNRPVYFEANLRHLAQLALADDVIPLFTSFAYLLPEQGQGGLAAQEFDQSMEEMNQVVQRVAQEQGIPFCDLFGQMSREPSYWVDFVHSSPPGALDKARILCDCILAAQLIDPQFKTPALNNGVKLPEDPSKGAL